MDRCPACNGIVTPAENACYACGEAIPRDKSKGISLILVVPALVAAAAIVLRLTHLLP